MDICGITTQKAAKNIQNLQPFAMRLTVFLLEKNGKASSIKRTRALNIRYFMVTDHVKKGELDIAYCSTDDMIGDYFTKALQGVKFSKFPKIIMGHDKE